MEPDSEQTVFDKLFHLLEPEAHSIEAGFQHCRFKLIKFFCWRHCDDPDNLVDETISRLIKNVRAGQTISADNPYSYLYAIARNVFREYLRARKKSCVINVEDLGDIVTEVPDADCKKQCLEALSEEKRELLARYYLDVEAREMIAAQQGMSLNALRLQIHRMKLALRRCCEECQKHSDTSGN